MIRRGKAGIIGVLFLLLTLLIITYSVSLIPREYAVVRTSYSYQVQGKLDMRSGFQKIFIVIEAAEGQGTDLNRLFENNSLPLSALSGYLPDLSNWFTIEENGVFSVKCSLPGPSVRRQDYWGLFTYDSPPRPPIPAPHRLILLLQRDDLVERKEVIFRSNYIQASELTEMFINLGDLGGSAQRN